MINIFNSEKMSASKLIVVLAALLCILTEQMEDETINQRKAFSILFTLIFEAMEEIYGVKGKQAEEIVIDMIKYISKTKEDYE